VTAKREHLIADEASAAVRTAQDALAEQARRGALTNDPLRHYLEAMSIGLGAMHKMFVDGTLTIARAIEEAKPQPVDHDTLRFAVIQGIKAHASGVVRALNWRNIIAGVTVVAVFTAIGFAGGWLVSQNKLVEVPSFDVEMRAADAAKWAKLIKLNSFLDMDKECRDAPQPNGRRACQVVLWSEPPKAPAQ
jgi:hypothetical protein